MHAMVEASPASAVLGPARVACFMMQKNETVLLDPWLRYHAHLFGASQLYVFDNGSTDQQVRQRLHRAEAEGVNVLWDFRGREHFERKGEVFRDAMRQLPADACDFVMPLDCDEFVARVTLAGEVTCARDAILGYLAEQHRGDPRVLLIRGSYFNIPEQPGIYFFRSERKCFLAHGMVKALGMGFHQATSWHSDVESRTELVHFHYRHKPYRLYDAHAREKLAARVAGFGTEELKGFRGKGSHMVRFMIEGEDSYLRYFDRFATQPLESLEQALRALGSELPF